MRNTFFSWGMCVHDIYFFYVACVSPSGSVLQDIFFGSGRVHEFFSCTFLLAEYFFFQNHPTPPQKLNGPSLMADHNSQSVGTPWGDRRTFQVCLNMKCHRKSYPGTF